MVAAHFEFIVDFPVVSNSNPNKIHEFYEKLIVSMQVIDIMPKVERYSRVFKAYS